MKKVKVFSLLTLGLLAFNCQSKNKNETTNSIEENAISKTELGNVNTANLNLDQYETAYFASGCFWCVEAIYESVKGVKEVVSGYSGGETSNPTYEKVSSGKSKHAEAVKIYYDPKVISYSDLVIIFFGSHDPTTLNQQGPDEGPQYRSIAFYNNDVEKTIIEEYIKKIKSNKMFGDKPITTQVIKFTKFYDAEDYHQNYETLHPNNSYIQNVSVPRINAFKKKFPNYLK